jgi:hypothetical protein
MDALIPSPHLIAFERPTVSGLEMTIEVNRLCRERIDLDTTRSKSRVINEESGEGKLSNYLFIVARIFGLSIIL